MASTNPYSLEAFITSRTLFLSALMLTLTGSICWLLAVPLGWSLVINLLVFVLLVRFVLSFKRKIMQTFNRATLHLDAIANEDYNQFAKSSFKHGKVAEFHRQLRRLSEQLQQQKSRYDQQAFLVYQLISQLDTPVLVFNEKHLLTYSNEAFSSLFGQPWQVFRHYTPERLGLLEEDGVWTFSESDKQSKWQIRHSDFFNEGETHQLFVCINIESALRQNQLDAWQQLIRVLSHEIRNSLTPVSSMAESLAERSESAREKQALTVITDRCLHLQQFVERYSSLSKRLTLSKSWIVCRDLIASLQALFNEQGNGNPSLTFETHIQVEKIWGDIHFLEQVFINLIKNAREANASKITISVSNQEAFTVVEISDNGHGFANIENLFVPLYSTKPEGQGIGLNFCRNVVEQHNGVLEAANIENGGATFMIILPSKNV